MKTTTRKAKSGSSYFAKTELSADNCILVRFHEEFGPITQLVTPASFRLEELLLRLRANNADLDVSHGMGHIIDHGTALDLLELLAQAPTPKSR